MSDYSRSFDSFPLLLMGNFLMDSDEFVLVFIVVNLIEFESKVLELKNLQNR